MNIYSSRQHDSILIATTMTYKAVTGSFKPSGLFPPALQK